MPDDLELQARRRQFIKQVISGLNAIEARRAQRDRNQQRPDSRP